VPVVHRNLALLREVLRAHSDLRRTNRFAGTALISAGDCGQVGVVPELLRTDIAVDHVNRLGWTALLEAVIRRRRRARARGDRATARRSRRGREHRRPRRGDAARARAMARLRRDCRVLERAGAR
jgi:hypothetical protein